MGSQKYLLWEAEKGKLKVLIESARCKFRISLGSVVRPCPKVKTVKRTGGYNSIVDKVSLHFVSERGS